MKWVLFLYLFTVIILCLVAIISIDGDKKYLGNYERVWSNSIQPGQNLKSNLLQSYSYHSKLTIITTLQQQQNHTNTIPSFLSPLFNLTCFIECCTIKMYKYWICYWSKVLVLGIPRDVHFLTLSHSRSKRSLKSKL